MKRIRTNQGSAAPFEKLYYASKLFSVGEIGVACSEAGLCEVNLRKPAAWLQKNEFKPRSDRKAILARQAISEIEEFLNGRRLEFTVPLDLKGTAFQMRVWKELRKIPYGETRSYADIARAVGRPRAYRAVGMANHWNPVAIIIPCHRVVASDGSLGGYAGGLEMKARLLEIEASVNIPGRQGMVRHA